MWRTTYIKFSLGGEQDEKIVIFAGTTEGRRLSEILADAGIAHTVCVATEYGEIVMREQTDAEAAGTKGQPLVSLHRGRMDRQQMEEFLRNEGYEIVVDATHPYAKVVTENLQGAVAALQTSEKKHSFQFTCVWNGKFRRLRKQRILP